MVGIAWLLLFSLTVWLKNVVIGRPLAEIEKTLSSATGTKALPPGKDLEELADRLHGTLWALIHTQRKREEDIARQMVRAEQLASLGELAAGLTHEIKNPLAGVAAALELLKSEDEEGTPNREVYDQMLSELRRVSGTVDGLLRLAKPQPPQRIDTDLARTAREVGSLFSARLRRQIVKLDLDISDSVPVLALDPGLMVQLLVNLLTNAMQAIDRGGTIKVMVAPFPKRDGVVLIVADNGKGIARADLDRIFDPFFTTKENGTGLGLAICRQIVEQHGGTINIESEVGNGTRVVVLLPDVAVATGRIHGLATAG
jgi:signal transduction histidine kinase